MGPSGYVLRSTVYREPMKDKADLSSKQQLGVRIDINLVVEAKVLAARQRRRLNDLIEEALRDLLKKHGEKRKEGR